QAGGEVAGFADPQRDAYGGESRDRTHEGVGDMGRGPDDNGQRIAEARADLVDDAAEADIAHRIGRLEPEHDVAIGDLVPAVFLLQHQLEHADDLAIDIIDGRGREEQGADHPAEGAGTTRDRGVGGGLRIVHLGGRHVVLLTAALEAASTRGVAGVERNGPAAYRADARELHPRRIADFQFVDSGGG